MARILDELIHRTAKLELRATMDDGAKLPKGVCGRLTGIALVYDVPDDYGTLFKQGCLDKTRADRVNVGKVKLLADHGPFTDMHVGTVRTLQDVGGAAVMSADIFDTEAGRRMKEYLEAVLGSGSETGLSIGFRPVKKEWKEVECGEGGGTEMILCYEEIRLGEISVTPAPAVPGTEVTGIRRKPGETDEDLFRRALTHILRELPEREARAVFDEVYASSAAPTDTPVVTDAPAEEEETPPAEVAEDTADAAPAESATETPAEEMATEEERLKTARALFAASAQAPARPPNSP
jgi:HK97 family phage prohead protease